MDGLGIDINEIIKSAYSTVLEIQDAATQTVGTNCLWARATPVINSEDIILQEYTLTQVGLECPKTIKVIVSNTDYNPGEYTMDLYGLQYVQPLEINITIQEWNNAFGPLTMPQKGDIVYTEIYHKLFEVQSSELIYSLASLPTYYKVVLSKYTPTSSRRETDEFKDSVNDLTVSQEELFGDEISQEVADTVVTNETAYNNTTYVDPSKDYDIDSIVSERIYGEYNNLITNAYYNFAGATSNITYHSSLIYEPSAQRNHLIYSCWVKTGNIEIQEAKIRTFKFHSKEATCWKFIILTSLPLNIGDSVTITRGSLLKINGTVVSLECSSGFGIAIKTSDMQKANKKLTNWYENASILKIYKTQNVNLLKGFDADSKQIINIDYRTNEIAIQFGDMYKYQTVPLNLQDWHYFMFDISPNNVNIIIHKIKKAEINTITDIECYTGNIQLEVSELNVEEFRIENMGSDIQMCNIRLYENEYPMGDAYMQDMYSPVTRNACKLILVDSPNVPNKSMFVSPVR